MSTATEPHERLADMEPVGVVCRDGQYAEPFSPAELAGIRQALRFYDSTDLVPRLVATVDQMVRDRWAED